MTPNAFQDGGGCFPKRERSCVPFSCSGKVVWILALTGSWVGAAESPVSPRPPALARQSFHFADPCLEIELVASEPQIDSPVSMAWDEHGRLFVAQMSDYPTGPGTGAVKRLEDRDGDGVYETATVFADRLPFPNSVLPWRDGVLVTAAPNLWFLRDTNDDGVADVQEVWFTGFAAGNQQLRANGLTWGHDGWIHGANGRSDGAVSTPPSTNSISLIGRDFRFHPVTRAFEPTAGRSQFGLARDDWGNRFLSWNTIPIRHDVIPMSIRGNEDLDAAPLDLLPAEDSKQVYPLTAPPLTFNRESTTHFNALGGLTLYRGDQLPEEYHGNAFVGETLRNLVHRRVLRPQGASFVAERVEKNQEFLASDDPWFHPVNFATGPDGCLYVADFYRQWVEHPSFVPERLRNEATWRAGSNHGRIWRIRKKGEVRKPEWFTAQTDWVSMLEHPNAWQRDTAQRLILDGSQRGAEWVGKLEALRQRSSNPVARLLSLRTLRALGPLSESTLKAALKDPEPRVVADAVQVAAEVWDGRDAARLATQLALVENHADPRVRLQFALALRKLPWEARSLWWDQLTRLEELSPAMRSALLFSGPNGQQVREAVGRWLSDPPSWWVKPSRDHLDLLRDVGALFHKADQRVQEDLLRNLVLGPTGQGAGFPSVLQLVSGILRRVGEQTGVVRSFKDDPEFAVFRERVKRTFVDDQVPYQLRDAASTFVKLFTVDDAYAELLLQRFRVAEPGVLPLVTMGSLLRWNSTQAVRRVIADWPHIAPKTRPTLAFMMEGNEGSEWQLAAALTNGIIRVEELLFQTRMGLTNASTPELSSLFRQILTRSVDADRKKVIDHFQPSLALTGNSGEGAKVFAKACLTCHTMGAFGNRVGPDLGGLISRPKPDLLVDILDPSRQVADDYRAYEVTLKKGEAIWGILVSESDQSYVLRRPSMGDESFLKKDVEAMRVAGKSLMPEGLEAGLTPQGMADLLEFLHRPVMSALPREYLRQGP